MKLFFSMCLVVTVLTSCAQTKYSIKKIYAFSVEHLPGNIPVDPNGKSLYRGPDTLNTVFIELQGEAVHWNTAWKNGKVYNIDSSPVTGDVHEIGQEKVSGKKVIIQPAKGNRLFRLELVPTDRKIKSPMSVLPGQILIKGKAGNKVILRKITDQVELVPIPSV